MIYKYEYETIKCNFDGWGLAGGNIYAIEDYRKVINERGKKGWRYVGYIPLKQRGTGHVQEIDLVFEKKFKKNDIN